MKIAGLVVTGLWIGGSMAQAGGIDRSTLPYPVLFEEGRVMQLGFTNVNPNVRGAYAPRLAFAGGGVAQTGDMAESYQTLSFAYKADITDKLSYAVLLNTPYGADSKYTAGFFTGLEARWESEQLAVLLKYQIASRVSVYGGVRYVRSRANITIPDQMIRGGLAGSGDPTGTAIAASAPAGSLAYTASGDSNGQFGSVIGVAYERPEIALRVGLTYESGVTHDFRTTEVIAGVPGISGIRTTDVSIPQSVTLDFQTGVAKDTLVFGAIRWSEWSIWEVRPAGYDALFGEAITSFDDDVTTFSLGVGRRVNDTLSLFARVSYEKSNGGVTSRLSPTDGARGFALGAAWTQDNIKVTGGIEYVKLGDAVDQTDTRFTGNEAVGVGLTVMYSF